MKTGIILFLIMIIIILIAFPAFEAHAAYDPNDGSIYSCNEGNTPTLCKKREQQRINLELKQKAENDARDERDNLKKSSKK